MEGKVKCPGERVKTTGGYPTEIVFEAIPDFEGLRDLSAKVL
jgi:hypothetical protein